MESYPSELTPLRVKELESLLIREVDCSLMAPENEVALPVMFKKKDCQGNAGCAEVMNGDNITLAATGDSAKVTLYGFDGPRYVPP